MFSKLIKKISHNLEHFLHFHVISFKKNLVHFFPSKFLTLTNFILVCVKNIMKLLLTFMLFCTLNCAFAQDDDVYNDLLTAGKIAYESGNCEMILKKWKAALGYPNLSEYQKQSLRTSIALCSSPDNPTQTATTFKIPEMVFVQGGSFKMGSNEYDNEKPPHTVSLKNFSIGKYEITVAQFATFVKESAYITTAETEGSSFCYIDGSWQSKGGVFWKCDVYGDRRTQSEYNHPVIHVSWNDAVAYCEWLSGKTRKSYRLPTEAEWEYAARGGNKNSKYTFSGSNTIDDVAWYDSNSSNETHSVGIKQANELGIYDMSGNVWEWCSDWYGKTYYSDSPANNPTGPSNGSSRVLRGGSWNYFAQNCRVANRYSCTPTISYHFIGFRVILVSK